MIEKVFVAGAGLMGQGIAQVIATAGISVLLYDVSPSVLDRAMEQIRSSLEKLAGKGRISESAETVLARLQRTETLADAAQAQLVLEAIPERLELKQELFSRLEQLVPAGIPFASNTSAIPISKLAESTQRPDLFCGLHFFNPVPLMQLVEIVRGTQTSDDTISLIAEFSRRIGKQPVFVQGEKSGFIVNRILGAAMIEAVRLYESGQATAEDIDLAMKLGCGWKMGPLETADLAGLDVVMNMCDVMQQGNSDQVFAPPETLRELVASGALGRKSGKGFYNYTSR